MNLFKTQNRVAKPSINLTKVNQKELKKIYGGDDALVVANKTTKIELGHKI